MIVDVHTHLPKHKRPVKVDNPTYYTARPGHPVSEDLCWDDHLRAMEAVDGAIVCGTNPEDVSEYTKLHPGKFAGFFYVDPRREDATMEVERGVKEFGLKGLGEIGPTYDNYHPFSDRACRVYSKAQELGIPILFHFGTQPTRLGPLEYAHPLHVEKIAIAFPDLKIVIAHMGHPWIPDTIVLVRKHPNVYTDISALFYRPWQFYNALVLCKEYDQMHKLLFGSDFSVTTPRETIDEIRKVNCLVEGSNLPKVSSADIEGIIQRNAFELLGIH
jgi:uncharacterized protein